MARFWVLFAAFTALFGAAHGQDTDTPAPARERSRGYVMLGAGSAFGIEGGAILGSGILSVRLGLAAVYDSTVGSPRQFVDNGTNIGSFSPEQHFVWGLATTTLLFHGAISPRAELGAGLGVVFGARAFTYGHVTNPEGQYEYGKQARAFWGGMAVGPRLVAPSFQVGLGQGRTRLAIEGVADLLIQVTGQADRRTYPQVMGRVGLMF